MKFLTEDKIRTFGRRRKGGAFLIVIDEDQRWSETGPCCPRCGDTDVYKMMDRRTGERSKRFLWLCKGCKRQHTVRVGTVYGGQPHPAPALVLRFLESLFKQKGRIGFADQARNGPYL